MHILKNYSFSLILILGILIGGIAGVVFGEATVAVKPIGDMFLNMLFVLVVPLVFFSVSSSICNLKQDGKLVGKLIGSIIVVFFITAVVAALIAYLIMFLFNPFEGLTLSSLGMDSFTLENNPSLQMGEILTNTLTVSDFILLFQKNNLLPLILFSILFGVAASMLGEKASIVSKGLQSISDVVLKVINLVMYAAPLGLGCYFAYTIGQLGSQLLNGFLYAFFQYLMMAGVAYFLLNTLYTFISAGKKGVRRYWGYILTPSLTAIATTSSAACIGVNIECARAIGVPKKIAETVIPLGTNLHKDGSVMGGVLKIVFLLSLFSAGSPLASNVFVIIGIALLTGLVMGAIPSGGMTGELLICSLLGFPIEMIGALMIISTIIDIPATLVNSTGNVVCSMLVARLSGGKKWMKESLDARNRQEQP